MQKYEKIPEASKFLRIGADVLAFDVCEGMGGRGLDMKIEIGLGAPWERKKFKQTLRKGVKKLWECKYLSKFAR